MGLDREQRWEEKGDQLPELPRLGAGIASGGWGMHWPHTHVNRSGDVVTTSSCILGREEEGGALNFSPATALKRFPLPLSSSIRICSVEAGLKSVFGEKQILCWLDLW